MQLSLKNLMELYVTQYDLNGIDSLHVYPLNSPRTSHPIELDQLKRIDMKCVFTVLVVNLIRVGLTGNVRFVGL